MPFRAIILLSFFLWTTTIISESKPENLTIDCLLDNYQTTLDQALPSNFYVKAVCYDLDFSYDQKTVSYLTGLENNTETTKQQVQDACFYLKQLGRFKNITLTIQKQSSRYTLTFHLVGHVIFSHLKLSGYMRNKDFYKNMYLLDHAETFDMQKHQHSLDLIKQYFYDKGYFQAHIEDELQQGAKDKSIAVHLTIHKGKPYAMTKINCQVKAIGPIDQTTVSRMQREIEQRYAPKLLNKICSQELLKKIRLKIKSMLERNGFMNFDLTLDQEFDHKKHTVSITISVSLEQKKEFVFFGNHFFTKQELLDHLLLYGKSSWHFPAAIIIDELTQLYKNSGFWHTAISIREEKDRIFCVIDEGKRIAITTVLCKNNAHFSIKELEKKVFKHFLKTDYFDSTKQKKALDDLIRFYKQHGFWDIKIIQETYEPQPEHTSPHNATPYDQPTNYALVITLDEGKQRKIGTCSIPGFKDLEQQGPFESQKKMYGFAFDQTILLEQKQWLLRHFKDLGYTKATIECQLRQNNEHLDVIWHVNTSEPAIKFGKIVTLSNSCIPTDYLHREARFKTGDHWDKTKLDDTTKQLRVLDLFETIQLYPGKDIDAAGQKPIFIKVIDANRYELRTKMGFQQVGKDFRLGKGHTYKIGASCLMRNPFQVADKLLLEGDFTKYYRNFALSYHLPWLKQKPIRSQYKCYDTMYDQPIFIGSKYALYQASQRGFLCNMSYDFSNITTSGNMGIEYMGIKEADQPKLQNIIDYSKNLLGKRTGYLFFEPNIMWQQFDSVINPRCGYLSFISCKGMLDLDTKTSFLKVLLEHSQYIPIGKLATFAMRMRIGHVFNRHYNQLIPIERFYLGGASTLRGYERDYCPPLGLLTVPIQDEYGQLPTQAGNLWRFAPQGGRTVLNANTEIRFRIYNKLQAAVFTDIGALFKDSITEPLKNYQNTLVGGSGFGFRFDTPIGALRFDLGFKWHRIYKDFETRCVWYLTLGQAF